MLITDNMRQHIRVCLSSSLLVALVALLRTRPWATLKGKSKVKLMGFEAIYRDKWGCVLLLVPYVTAMGAWVYQGSKSFITSNGSRAFDLFQGLNST